LKIRRAIPEAESEELGNWIFLIRGTTRSAPGRYLKKQNAKVRNGKKKVSPRALLSASSTIAFSKENTRGKQKAR